MMLLSLACSSQAAVSKPVKTSDSQVYMIVTAETLHIRDAPNGVVGKIYLKQGDVVIVDEISEDEYWCHHEKGWSACRYLKGY